MGPLWIKRQCILLESPKIFILFDISHLFVLHTLHGSYGIRGNVSPSKHSTDHRTNPYQYQHGQNFLANLTFE